MNPRFAALRFGPAAAGVWLLCGIAFGVVVWSGLLRGDVVRLLVPETIDPRYWQSRMPWPIVIPAASTLLIGALVTAAGGAVIRRAMGSPRGVVVPALWLVVVAAFTAVGTLIGIAVLVGRGAPGSISTIAQGLPDALAPSLYAGLVTGWIPALIGTIGWNRAATAVVPPPTPRDSARNPLRILGTVAAVLAIVSAGGLATSVAAESAQAKAAGLAGEAPPPVQRPLPTPVPTGTPPPTRAAGDHPIDPSWCTDSQLTFADLGGDAATGHREESVSATNTGRDACVLPGYPDVAFADEHGAEVPAAVRDGSGFMTADPGPTALSLAPGEKAVAWLAWDATDGRTIIPDLYLAPYAGADRQLVATGGMDITAQTEVAVTAWARPASPAP